MTKKNPIFSLMWRSYNPLFVSLFYCTIFNNINVYLSIVIVNCHPSNLKKDNRIENGIECFWKRCARKWKFVKYWHILGLVTWIFWVYHKLDHSFDVKSEFLTSICILDKIVCEILFYLFCRPFSASITRFTLSIVRVQNISLFFEREKTFHFWGDNI